MLITLTVHFYKVSANTWRGAGELCELPQTVVFHPHPFASITNHQLFKNPLSLVFWHVSLQEDDKPRKFSDDVIKLDREHLRISAPLQY